MGWSKKKADPISDRARALNEEIAALEAQIKKLGAQANASASASAASAPKLRSTAHPHGASTQLHPQPTSPPPAPPSEPIFEEVDQKRLKEKSDAVTPEHFNDLGVRKYDLAAFLRRIKNHFHGPSTTNPKLVSYLAAGSIQGLRPMRYEKRVTRNRTIFVMIIFLALLIGIFAIIHNHH